MIHSTTRSIAALALAWGLTGGTTRAQVPVIPPPLPPSPPCASCGAAGGHTHEPGPIKRAAHHVAFTVKDKMIGYPEYFRVPPLGYSVNNWANLQAARGAQNEFTFYRSDFYADSDQLTPNGAWKLTRMASRLNCWPGLILVEHVADRPGLAERRREALLASWTGVTPMPLDASRLVVGRSPYYGLRGDNAARTPNPGLEGYYEGLLFRDTAAGTGLPLPPVFDAQSGGGAMGGMTR